MYKKDNLKERKIKKIKQVTTLNLNSYTQSP